MKIVFFGASELGWKCCRRIVEKKLAEVTCIFTIPKEFNISYSEKPVTNVNFADFHSLGKEFNIPVISVTAKMGDYTEEIRKYLPDMILVIGWYYIVPKSIREIPKLGCAGMHASLLPKYRGGAPLVWAMINGEKKTGLSFFYLEEGVDNGDIISQKEFPIKEDDFISDLIAKTTDAALEIIDESIQQLAEGKASRTKQNDTEATYVPQRKPEDGKIDWSWDPERIRNFIRAQSKPYPGAFTEINDKKVIIWNADIIEI